MKYTYEDLEKFQTELSETQEKLYELNDMCAKKSTSYYFQKGGEVSALRTELIQKIWGELYPKINRIKWALFGAEVRRKRMQETTDKAGGAS